MWFISENNKHGVSLPGRMVENDRGILNVLLLRFLHHFIMPVLDTAMLDLLTGGGSHCRALSSLVHNAGILIALIIDWTDTSIVAWHFDSRSVVNIFLKGK